MIFNFKHPKEITNTTPDLKILPLTSGENFDLSFSMRLSVPAFQIYILPSKFKPGNLISDALYLFSINQMWGIKSVGQIFQTNQKLSLRSKTKTRISISYRSNQLTIYCNNQKLSFILNLKLTIYLTLPPSSKITISNLIISSSNLSIDRRVV